jgi:hypothetical protein
MKANNGDSTLLDNDAQTGQQTEPGQRDASKESNRLGEEKDRVKNDGSKTNTAGQGQDNRIEESKREEKKDGKQKDGAKKEGDGLKGPDQNDRGKSEENKKDIKSKDGVKLPGKPEERPKPEVKKTVEEDLAGFFDDPKPDPKGVNDGKKSGTQGEKKTEGNKNISQKKPFTNDPFEDDDVFGDPKPKKEDKGGWPEPDVKKKDKEGPKPASDDKKKDPFKPEEKPNPGEQKPGPEAKKDDKIGKQTGGLFDDDFFDAAPEKKEGGAQAGEKGKAKEIGPGKKVEVRAEEKVKTFEVGPAVDEVRGQEQGRV